MEPSSNGSTYLGPPTRTRPEPPRRHRTSPQIREPASLTRSLASSIRPIMAMSTGATVAGYRGSATRRVEDLAPASDLRRHILTAQSCWPLTAGML